MARLATRLRNTGIKDVYVHSGPFAMDGRLDPAKYPNAGNFVQLVAKELPRSGSSAWLGQKVDRDAWTSTTRKPGRASWTAWPPIMTLGFDGIHYNFEPLDAATPTSSTCSTGPGSSTRLLSTSTPQIEPFLLMRVAASAVVDHDKYWSPGYFQQVVARIDQVAVMTYDSGMPLQSLYGGHVVRQAALALDLVPETKSIFIGAPAYHDHGISWSDAAESVALAAQGAKLALSDHGRRERFGLALYVDFAATEQDWQEYSAQWLS